jgi:alkylation response protein AidB-like acyl-CoA dehydrogenase
VALTKAGWLGALIPEEFGGLGAPISTSLIVSYIAEHVLGLPCAF